jgi:hypothetical protein
MDSIHEQQNEKMNRIQKINKLNQKRNKLDENEIKKLE